MRLFCFLFVVFFSLTSTFALAQERPCRFSVQQTKPDGTVVSVCADNARQINAAATALGSLDPRRSSSTYVSPDTAVTNLSSGYPPGYGQVLGGYYPPPDDQRQARAIRDSILDGVRVTTFEDQLRQATDGAIRDGQHAVVMMRLDEIEVHYMAEMERLSRFLAAAIKTGNVGLQQQFRSQIDEVKRELAKVKAKKGSSKIEAEPTGSAKIESTPTPTEVKPNPAAKDESTDSRRLTQSRNKN